MPELLARVRVALRHQAARSDRGAGDQAVLVVGDLVVDIAHHCVIVREPRYAVYDAPEHLLPVAMAIARAESFWELPVIGRFLQPTTA
ncbi:MAG TPA: hypothetical protein VGO92_08525 [Acidimicrobiales bacterium]|jgi:DNA-binding response OmpR family regulator|nr:hypothetical protein [Acidimicrobiales bacterium]